MHNTKYNPTLKVGGNYHGFFLERVYSLDLPELDIYILRHEKTGADYIHLSCPDVNNSFAVGFKTIPEDSTGVAHILEHVVLTGSRKYPIRDPFFSMLNRSVNSFMNAFTSSDWTLYPFATPNRLDFQNLLRVYMDAAFFPEIKKESFMQEGVHLAMDESKPHRLSIKGVVFNEMKGAMSSQADMMYRKTTEALYPGITYHFNSGGDPVEIPKLTYDSLLDFFKRFYHPTNSKMFSYGSFELEPHLEIVQNEYLKDFEHSVLDYGIPNEKRYTSPQSFRYTYPATEEKTYQSALAWLTNPISDVEKNISMNFLDNAILGNAASPLRKTLIESKLGKALSDITGYCDDRSETFFAAGLQGLSEQNASQVSGLVLDTLKNIVSNGIDRRQIESVINNFEIEFREHSNSGYPRGLQLLLKTYPYWVHGGRTRSVAGFRQVNREYPQKDGGQEVF